MNIFGVGPLELALVLIIAVIVLGPERIPEVAVQMARVFRSLRGFATDATSDLRKELDELTRDYQDVRKELQDFRESINSDVRSVGAQLTKAIDDPVVEASGELPPDRNNGASVEMNADALPKPKDDDSL